MTRFQIVGIFADKILAAGEFNGDGYFEGHGKEVCARFMCTKTKMGYYKLVKWINKEYFEYSGKIVFEIPRQYQGCDIFDFKSLDEQNLYFEMWFSDYLYIKNFTDEDQEIIDNKGVKIILHPQGYVTINFGKCRVFEDVEAGKNIKSINNATVDANAVISYITDICEDYGWTVSQSDISDDSVYISQYTPAGEDFGFYVDIEDLANNIKEYAECFDVDEHAKSWIDGNGAPSIRTLLEDAEWIKEELETLADAVIKR